MNERDLTNELLQDILNEVRQVRMFCESVYIALDVSSERKVEIISKELVERKGGLQSENS